MVDSDNDDYTPEETVTPAPEPEEEVIESSSSVADTIDALVDAILTPGISPAGIEKAANGIKAETAKLR